MNKLTDYAKNLRQNMTDVEHLLWNHLRAKRLNGAKFKRQHPIANYIVDFVCFEAQLIVEIDGSQHAEQKAYDKRRDTLLNSYGFTVLRFWNNEILENLEGALSIILEQINAHKTKLLTEKTEQ